MSKVEVWLEDRWM